MSTNTFREELKIPQGVKVEKKEDSIIVKGKLGEISKKLKHPKVRIEVGDDKVAITTLAKSKREGALVGTYASHLKNMFAGVENGYTYKMKIVHTHFPITVKIVGKFVQVENYLGERTLRKAEIVGSAKVEIKGEDLFVTGPNLEDVSQTAANAENATRITGKDRRKFKDGIYIVTKAESGMEKI